MKRKMRRLLAMLLAFTLTFTVASTDVLAAGLEMAGEESVATNEIAEFAEAEGADAGEEVIAGTEDSAGIDGENIAGAKATATADGEDLDGVKATATADIEDLDGVKATADTVEDDLADAGADDADGADAGADDADGADAGADDADGADADTDAVNEEDGAETEDGAEAEDAAEMAEDEDETLAEVGGSPRLRSFGAPRSLSLSNTGFSEGFEGDGIPEGWTLETDTEGYNWSVADSHHHSGSKAAHRSFTSGDGQTAWLITPAFDFSGIAGIPVLSFWYLNTNYKGAFEELRVCYRVSGGEWQELFKTESAHNNWTKQILYLPDGAKKADVEIGFQCVNHDAYGTALDDVQLKIVDEIRTYAVAYHANGGTGTVTDPGSPYGDESAVVILPNGFTASPGKYFASWNTKADGSGTKYNPGDIIEITDNVTLYAQWADLSTDGFAEGFDVKGIPSEWKLESDTEGCYWMLTNAGFHTGGYSAYGINGSGTAWLIMPAFNLSGVTGSIKLRFWYKNPIDSGNSEELSVCYRVNGGEWQELFKTESAHGSWTKQILYLPENAKKASLEIGFKCVDHNGKGAFIDDVFLEVVPETSFSVTYQANGGTGAVTDIHNPYADETSVTILQNGFTAPPGKYFTSWNTKADGSGTKYLPGDVFEIAGNVTLYAQWAQPLTSGFEEGFDGEDIPDRWKLETNTEDFNWIISFANVHSGEGSAFRYCKSGDGQTAWLIMPMLDLSGNAGIPRLRFWYLNKAYNAVFDELGVCYRVNGGEWIELFKTESASEGWTKQIVVLPDGAKTANVEVGFKCVNHDGKGVYLDDVLFEIVDSLQSHAVTYDANGGTGTMTDEKSPYMERADVTILPNGFTRSQKYFTCWNTKADGSGTTYYPGDVFEITGNVTLYAQWADASSGLNEGFEATGIPVGWTVIADNAGNQWYVGMETNYDINAHSGEQMAIMNEFNSNYNGTSWLITPALDLSGAGKNWLLSFWYRNPVYSGLRFSLETYYRVNGGEWKVLSQISAAHDDWTEEEILLPEEARTTNVEIGFKALESYSYGVYLDDVVLQRSTTDYYSITVSGAMTGGSVKADKSYAEAGETITLNVTPDGISEFKTLTVKKGSTAIATTKVDETTYTFVMPEGHVTVAATFQRMKGIVFYEDFEDGGELPGWILTDADGDGNNWYVYTQGNVLDANGNDVALSGSRILTSASYNNGELTPDNWAITPVITIPANARLSFWIRGQDINYPNEKMAVYVGTGANVEEMTKVGGDYTATNVFENYVVDLGAYANQSIRIAFRHYNVTDEFRLNLDDVCVTGRSGDATTGTLTYDANGGSGETTDSKNPYFLGKMATVLPCGFTAQAGMEFMGWNTESDGSGASYSPGDAILMDGDKTLYAMWVKPSDLITYLEEGFESGAIPEGWSLENEDDGYSWAINQQGTRVGNYSANADWSSVETKGKSSWLITPAINLSGVKGPACLSFMLVNDDYYGKVDEFGVYYRIGGGAWQVLFYTSEAHDGYGMDPEIYLPNEVKVANVQFAFRAIDRSGKGVSLDEILLTGVKEVKAYYAVTYNANGGSGETVDLSSPYQKNDTATVMPNLFTAPEGKKFDSWNTKADGTGTTYYPAQTFTVTGAVTLYARWKDIPPMPTELDEGFEGGVIPEEWTMESDSESYRWTVGTGDYQLTPGAHSGGKNALIRHAANDSTAWLITPALDLRGEKDCLLSFWYLNRKWGTDTDAFKVCYRVAGGAWTELFYTQEPHGTWTEKILRVPKEARAEGVEFGFWALDKYGRGVGLDDVQVKVYDHPVSLLTIEDSTNGTMTADATGIRNAGDAVTLTVTPNEGYQLAEIQLKDGSACPAIKKDTSVKYLFTMPEGDVTMEAKFYAEGATYSYNLYVGGSQITTDNDLDVLGNGEVSYDGITKVLTFKKDVTYTYGDAVLSNVNGLIIKTITEVTITSGADDAMQLNGQTVIEAGDLLTLKGAAEKGGYGIYAKANVAIRNSKMNVFGKWGLYSSSGKVITIENSVVTAQGPYGAVNGIDLVDCDVVAPVGGMFSEGGLIRESTWSVAEKATVSPVIEVTADNPYFEGFEGHSIPRDWTFIDADGDGKGWNRYSVSDAVLHSGNVALSSASYLDIGDQALTPDNWAYLPALKIPENAELSFWLASQLSNWTGDVLGVFVGTTLNPEDMTQLGEDFVSTAKCVEHKLDLSAYAGQTVFIAFRHYNCTDRYQLNLDDVTVKVDESALTDNNLVIAKKSLTLQNTIAIDFKIAKSAIEGKYHDPYLVVTQNGEEAKITKWEPSDDGTLMIFSYRVAPHNMRDVVTAVPHALNANGEDVTGVSVDYSVTDYCYNMLGKDTYQTDAWAPFRRLLVDILLYGDAAQKFTGYKTTELPSWKLTSAQRAMGTDVTVPMSYSNVKDVNFETVNASDEKAKIVTAALYLEASVNIQFKFTADDLTGLKVVVTDGENVLETLTPDPSKKDSNGRYYVTFGKLNAGQMRKTVYATVMQGTKKVSNTMQYSIESYAASQSNSTVANLPELLHAMMRYGDSAKAVAEMLGQ